MGTRFYTQCEVEIGWNDSAVIKKTFFTSIVYKEKSLESELNTKKREILDLAEEISESIVEC